MFFASSWSMRLASMAPISVEDEDILSGLTSGNRQRKVDAAFVESKDAADRVLVVVAGLAGKFRLLADGRRQILSYLFPGDMTSPERLLHQRPDQSVSILCHSQIALLDRNDMQRLRNRPNICEALARYALVREAIASEWQTNVGIRTALERISHLLCEMYTRLSSVGMARNHSFRLSLTQLQIAESVALSAVHVNRVLMGLRRDNVLSFSNGVVTILKFDQLCRIAGFDSSYLQVHEASGPDAHLPATNGARSNGEHSPIL